MSPLSPRPTFSSYPEDSGDSHDTGDTGVRRREVFFQSVADIDRRVRERRASLDGAILTVAGTGARFVLRDAMRILGSAQGADVFGMTGRVVALSELLSLGASISASTLRFGSVEYEVQPGYLVQTLSAA